VLRCAYNRYDPVAAHGSSAWSTFSGVREFGGGVCLVANECFEFVDIEPCRDSCPRDMLRSSMIDYRGQSIFSFVIMAAC
jgi:hypothetical protein